MGDQPGVCIFLLSSVLLMFIRVTMVSGQDCDNVGGDRSDQSYKPTLSPWKKEEGKRHPSI